ncbi:2Fe-2S iron-sulfur cluster binding domain-containing protein [Mycobacterium barrassiae]|uniref:2Fe-2S iron-sulfur cluster-binding protein n=1 Tax=Mycobacterium barrassiae TaxID=319709 RepID=UPI002265F745|nr:2Fe-2S iron-sulfur cluster binding domain-containing protein [Mycobacterium barrassiae]MCV7303601.1 2Fe-2S iron-sulfur cluster binding domain-containing protein [Mycobacterium barrassiae]
MPEVEIDLDGRVHRVTCPSTRTLVDAMLDAGIDVPHSCREGHCGSCVTTVVEGDVDMPECDLLGADELSEGLVLGCQAKPLSDRVRIEY